MSERQPSLPKTPGTKTPGAPKLPANLVIAAATLALTVVYAVASRWIRVPLFGGPVDARAFPLLLSIAMLGASLLLVVEHFRVPSEDPGALAPAAPRSLPTIGAAAAWTALYIAAFEPVGYVVSTGLYLLALMAYFNRGRWVTNLLAALGFSVISYGVLVRFLGASLPKGIYL